MIPSNHMYILYAMHSAAQHRVHSLLDTHAKQDYISLKYYGVSKQGRVRKSSAVYIHDITETVSPLHPLRKYQPPQQQQTQRNPRVYPPTPRPILSLSRTHVDIKFIMCFFDDALTGPAVYYHHHLFMPIVDKFRGLLTQNTQVYRTHINSQAFVP